MSSPILTRFRAVKNSMQANDSSGDDDVSEESEEE